MATVYEAYEPIPLGGAHDEAVCRIMAGLGGLAYEGPGRIAGFMMYGSESPDPRSDRDFYVVYEESSQGDALQARINALVAEVQRITHVHIDMHATSLDEVKLEHDTIAADILFAHYLALAARQAPERLRFGNPAIGLKELKRRPQASLPGRVIQSVNLYVGDKRRLFFSSLAASEQLNVRAMQRAYELPVAVGRKVLMMYAVLADGPQAEAPNDKSAVYDELLALHGNDPAWFRPLEALRTQDQAYSRLLERKIRGEIDDDEYRASLIEVQRDVLAPALDLTLAVGAEAVRLAKDLKK